MSDVSGVPGFCEKCGTLFMSNAIAVGAGATVKLTNNKTDCPNCGAMARLLDGEFQGIANGIELLKSPQATFDILTRFRDILQAAQRRDDTTAEELVEKIEQEVPQLKAWCDFIIKNRSDIYFVINLILYFLAPILLGRCNQPAPNNTEPLPRIEKNAPRPATPLQLVRDDKEAREYVVTVAGTNQPVHVRIDQKKS